MTHADCGNEQNRVVIAHVRTQSVCKSAQKKIHILRTGILFLYRISGSSTRSSHERSKALDALAQCALGPVITGNCPMRRVSISIQADGYASPTFGESDRCSLHSQMMDWWVVSKCGCTPWLVPHIAHLCSASHWHSG